MTNQTTESTTAILRLIAKGHSYAQIVDHLPGVTYQDIFAAAGEALKAMEEGGTHVGYVETVRQTHQRAYKPWDDEEDAELTALHEEGWTNRKIAEHLGRQPSAIASRIKKLGLNEASGAT
ncbi:MAG: hypothetical protein RIB58_09570 [Phycisphaerales bacterium]